MKRYYARNLTVEQVDNSIAESFLVANHRQEDASSSHKIQSLGLYSGDNLLAVAVFSTPRTESMRRKYTVELLRMAFAKDVRIAGGASKLIRHFIESYKPADLFTYQDTTGENTRVYEHAGMALVKNGLLSKKQYLVAPGKTLATASRREAFSIAYATRYGPDRILGTSIGEVYDEKTGKRKTNPTLFVENLGWHIEETTADSIYEWIDPNRTYYTYRITASDSEKYYYGVSHVKITNATIAQCLDDGYWGSGGGSKGNKFRNWKQKHQANLKKEVLETFSRAAVAYEAENRLIGDSWQTDHLCLNSTAGGKSGGAFSRRQSFQMGECSSHGETIVRSGKCVKCWTAKRWSDGQCDLHGSVRLRDGKCTNCENLKTVALKECPIHGETKHQGSHCTNCRAEAQFSSGICETHGESVHTVDGCISCRNAERIELKQCPDHGLSKHIGDSCYRCFSATRDAICAIHGKSKHNGESCLKCVKAKSISLKNCAVHGETKFSGSSCMSCEAQKVVSLKRCPVHGETKHQGDKCSSCTNSALIALRVCPKHGETKHRGKSCYKCASERRKDRKSELP